MENSIQQVFDGGIPFKIEFDLESSAWLGLALFVALFLGLLLWSITLKALF